MNSKIFNVNDLKNLKLLGDSFSIIIHLVRPPFDDLLKKDPKQRRKIIHQRRRDIYKEFVNDLTLINFKRFGSHIQPAGVIMDCTYKQLLKLNKHKLISTIVIDKPEIRKIKNVDNVEHLFSVIARFSIQIENVLKGIQSYEDRTMLIKAKNWKDAEKKLRKGFKAYSKPYLNSTGELVRWQFEEFIDSYETDYESIENMAEHEDIGIEVYSVMKDRRIKEDSAWVIKYK